MELGLITREQAYEWVYNLPDGPEKDAAANLVLEVYGEPEPAPADDRFFKYRFEPQDFIESILKWTPWEGIENFPGQVEILQAIVLAIRQQLEKRDYELGLITEQDLIYYDPEGTIQSWIRIEAGNGVGKTKSISGVLLWFLYCFKSIIYTFSSSATQDEITTWKEVKKDLGNSNLPGKPLQTSLKLSEERFAMSRSPSKSGGKGEENTKGQHNEFLGFIVDEADGAERFIFNAIKTMVSGGIHFVLMLANPRDRGSRFHELKDLSYVKTLRISSLSHPNVVHNKPLIPGAVQRDFVVSEIEESFQNGGGVVTEHRDEDFTFELPYSIKVNEITYPAGTIFKPSPEFMTRILGIAPPNSLDNTFVAPGVYEAAVKRGLQKIADDPLESWYARVGVDGAREGDDNGTFYIRWNKRVWREKEIPFATTEQYVDIIATGCLKLKSKGVRSLHIRVDTACGSGVIDGLRIHAELKKAFDDFKVIEVHFGGGAHNSHDFDNVSTEMYKEAGESLKGLAVLFPPQKLEADLCQRKYKFINRQGKTKKILEEKAEFKKRFQRSPDDGDGCVLATAPDYCFKVRAENFAPVSIPKASKWNR